MNPVSPERTEAQGVDVGIRHDKIAAREQTTTWILHELFSKSGPASAENRVEIGIFTPPR